MMWGRGYARPEIFMEKVRKNEEIEIYENLYLTNNTDSFLSKEVHYIIDNNLKGIFHLASNDIVNYCEFLSCLFERLGYHDAKIKKVPLPGEKYYMALLSNRSDLPKEFQITNKNIVEYLSASR